MADITPIASLTGELAMPEKVWMQGPPGPQGQQGEPGAAATVTVGTVTTGEPGTDAIVTNSGTESAAVLDFTIPKGEAGPTGAGVPDGGTAGQLLGKTESGTAWIDPPQSGVQSDWNQNDETQPDFVKNRPFYTGDPVETVLVEESTVVFEDASDFYMGVLESTFSAIAGDTYKVYWDGTTYECICVVKGRTTIIGNLSIVGPGSDTGEPFFMSVENGQTVTIFTADTSASHTFSISGNQTPIVKIPAKYIDKNSSGYIVIHSKDTMTQQEAENYGTAISTKEVTFIIWNGMCISGISFIGTTGSDLQLITQNGEVYFIKKNANGLFTFSGRKLSMANFPNSVALEDTHAGIDIHNNKVIISKFSNNRHSYATCWNGL